MNHDSNAETAFWYNMLYFIGSHVMEVSRKANITGTMEKATNKNNILTKIFCGYWVLTNIASITKDDDHITSNE